MFVAAEVDPLAEYAVLVVAASYAPLSPATPVVLAGFVRAALRRVPHSDIPLRGPTPAAPAVLSRWPACAHVPAARGRGSGWTSDAAWRARSRTLTVMLQAIRAS